MEWRRWTWLLMLPLFAGCVVNGMAPEPEESGESAPELQADRLVIINDPAQLDTRVQYDSRPLFIRMKETPGREIAPPLKAGMTLTLVGEVESPAVEGLVVQANDIDIKGKTAVVAYNYAGEVFAGAVHVVDFTTPERPRLVSELLYRNADVTAVLAHGQNVYVGLGSPDPALQTPALLEEFKLTGAGLQPTGRWIDLPSWVVTDLSTQGPYVVASVGAREGGVAFVDRTFAQFQLDAFVAEEDIRGIGFPSITQLAAVCGTRPRMALMHVEGRTMMGAHAVDGYNNPEAKGTIEVHNGLCFLGAGDGGFQVRRADGELLAALRHEDFSDLRPDLMVTNAVSLSGNLAFVAAGALGVQVVDVVGMRGWALGGGHNPEGLRVLGELEFDDGVSSNMVKSENNVMVVAGGLGGIKLVTMD
ncbi:MAG: hypothetical protein JSW67_08025 [Candidatus Latescibacterota bacterium]|nr:MAG: hypothetical protein JSW67_08025 [Candidatus Latescibacterota bacterium]